MFTTFSASWSNIILFVILSVLFCVFIYCYDIIIRGKRPFIQNGIFDEIKKIFSKEFLPVWIALLIVVIMIYFDK